MKLKDLLKETVAEISYEKSGLKKPNLADLDKDKKISSWEKKRGGAIEKNMKTEFKSQAPKKEGIKFGNEERPMETMPSLSRSEMVAMDSRNNICKECGAAMMYEDKMCSECGYMEEHGDATSLPSSLIDGPVKDDEDAYSEGMDHEVSMAKASLQNIISNASALLNKLGDDEIDIPAWVQDHITNSDNYISQANDGYYEYENGENNEIPDQQPQMEKKGVDKFGYTQNGQAAGPFRGAQGPMQMASGNLEEKPSAGLNKSQNSDIKDKGASIFGADDKRGDYPVGDLEYRRQKNNQALAQRKNNYPPPTERVVLTQKKNTRKWKA